MTGTPCTGAVAGAVFDVGAVGLGAGLAAPPLPRPFGGDDPPLVVATDGIGAALSKVGDLEVFLGQQQMLSNETFVRLQSI